MDAAVTCCFTGHRPSKLPWGEDETSPLCRRLQGELIARLQGIYEAGYRHFICGLAAGCDLYFAEAILALRRQGATLTLEAAVPFDDQAERWNKGQQARYADLLSRCDQITHVSHLYTPDCMLRRNEYMIDRSSLLLACFAGTNGGTMKTILYAQRSGIKTEILEI